MSLRSAFWQQNLLYVIVSAFFGCYLWSVFILHRRVQERQQHTQLAKKVSDFYAFVLPSVDLKASFDTVTLSQGTFWTADATDAQGENSLHVCWDAQTGQLLDASAPTPNGCAAWLRTAPPQTFREARRACDLLLRLGERAWAAESQWTPMPGAANRVLTLYARRKTQRAMIGIDRATGAFRFFRVWPAGEPPALQ